MNAPIQESPWSAKRFLKWGFGTLAVLVLGLGAWATLTSISGAVVATGTLEVASSRQVVEHAEGGIVQRILVKDGDVVAAGEVLIKLDDTLMQSEYDIVEGQLFELLARHDRLIAERDEADNISFGKELTTRAQTDLSVQTILAGQIGLFVARQTAQREELAQLNEQKKQVLEQITGIEAQLDAVERQHGIVVNELTNQETLFGHGLPVAVIMCTNRLPALDPAVKRRAAEILVFERPEAKQRHLVLSDALAPFGMSAPDIDTLVDVTGPTKGRTHGFAFSDLTQRLIPSIILDAYPNSKVTGPRAIQIATETMPTPPFQEKA